MTANRGFLQFWLSWSLMFLSLQSYCSSPFIGVNSDSDSLQQIVDSASDTASAQELLELSNQYAQIDTILSRQFGNLSVNSAFAQENINFRINALIQFGHTLNKQGELHKGLAYLEEGLQTAQGANNQALEAKAHNYLGIFYNDRGNNVLAADHYIRSLGIARRLKDTIGMIKPHNNLAGIFLDQSRPEKAREYASEGLKLCLAFNDRRGEGFIRNNLAQAYLNLNEPEKAREQLEKSLIISTERNDVERMARNHSNLCICNRLMGDLFKAGYHCQKASDLLETINDPRSNMLHAIQYGLFYYDSNNLNKAEEYARRALNIGKSESLLMHMAEAHNLMHDIHKENGDYKRALEDHESFVEIKYGDKANNAKIAAIEDSYQQLLEENEKIRTETQLNLLRNESIISNSQRNYAIGLAVLLGAIGLLLYYRYYTKNSLTKILIGQNTQIENQNKIIEQALEEKETLLKEIHHRVKNNLQIVSSLLNLQSRKVEDEAVLASISEGQNRVQAMSLIHQALYQSDDVTTVAMQSYLDKLMQHLSYSFGFEQRNINYSVEAENINFDIDIAVPIGLMINELVSNSYKHAFDNKKEGNINVSITKLEKHKIRVVVKDDGIGICDHVNMNRPRGLGLKLVKTLGIKQLKGQVEVSGSNGTEIVLTFSDQSKLT